MAAERLSTRCCIVGGGPCGLMLGFLLARAGVDVVVLEKHGDFLRDFRGDTIHPSTLDVMGELGLLDEFLKLPHQKAPNLSAYFAGRPSHPTVRSARTSSAPLGVLARTPATRPSSSIRSTASARMCRWNDG